MMLVVVIDAALVDWNELGLQSLEVELKYGGRTQRQIFRAGRLPTIPPAKSFTVVNGDTTYSWKAIYKINKDGAASELETEEATADSDYLAIPNPGDVPMKQGGDGRD